MWLEGRLSACNAYTRDMRSAEGPNPSQVLGMLRPLVLVVDGHGLVRQAHGAFGGLLGYRNDELLGTSVFDLISTTDDLLLDGYVGPSVTQPFDPLPFGYRGRVLAADGTHRHVAVYVAGELAEDGSPWWVVTLIPGALDASSSRTLSAELSGGNRADVRRSLAAELARPDVVRPSRSFFVDLVSALTPSVASSYGFENFEALIDEAIAGGWYPWERLDDLDGFWVCERDEIPPTVSERLAEFGWRVGGVVGVSVAGVVAGAYILVVQDDVPPAEIAGSTSLHGRIGNLVQITQMVLERWIERDALALAASTDRLTGLGNRSVLEQRLARADDDTSLLYVDIDRFKAVNDTWGHRVGDEVLIEVARRLQNVCRPNDVVVRLGGDEFVVVLQNVDATTAEHIGRRIVNEASAPLHLPVGPESVSVSVGLSSNADLAVDRRRGSLLEAADAAMLSAKRQGRARLVTESDAGSEGDAQPR